MIRIFLIVTIVFFAALSNSFSQGDEKTVQLSGLIVEGDSAYGVPGVHIFINKAGRGTISDPTGFFSMPVISGDTITFQSIAHKNQKFIVPKTNDLGLTVLINLETDTTYLPVIEVFPYPTKELFKEAFLALNLRDDEIERMKENLSEERIRKMASSVPMDGSLNYKNYMDQKINQTSNQYFQPTFSILNPFAWANFIKSLKKKKKK